MKQRFTIVMALPYLSIILSLFPFFSTAQVRFEKDTVYRFARDILRDLNGSDRQQIARAAYNFSFIGDYRNALVYDGKMRQPYGMITRADSAYFKKFRPVNASEYIIERAGREQIIIINEAHHFPFHRTFIASLLKGLYAKGFRYYGAETLDYTDSVINQRKYPILSSGFYVPEPQFGNLLREALQLGYYLFAYEARTQESLGDAKRREFEQARHIQIILEKNPKAKILVHAGYDHIREDSLGGSWGKAMAGRLKELTGINPFTIDQEVLTERTDPSFENPFYKMTSLDIPSIFVDDSGAVFSGPEGTNYYDVRLYHPRTKYIKNRPHWLMSDGKRYVYVGRKNLSLGCPCLVQIYYQDENPETAVPTDVIEIPSPTHSMPVVLPPGKFQALVKGSTGKSKLIPLVVQ